MYLGVNTGESADPKDEKEADTGVGVAVGVVVVVVVVVVDDKGVERPWRLTPWGRLHACPWSLRENLASKVFIRSVIAARSFGYLRP